MDKTIFVLLDACQYEAASKYLGYLEHMIDYNKGAKYKVLGELPSLSKPMYATLFTGLPVCKHGVTCNEVGGVLPYDSVFSLCRKAGGRTAAISYSWMSELYSRAPYVSDRDRVQLDAEGSIQYGMYYWDDNYPDSHVFAEGECLRKTFDPDFMLYHTMAVDEWGHMKGADSAEYANAVAAVGTSYSGKNAGMVGERIPSSGDSRPRNEQPWYSCGDGTCPERGCTLYFQR